MTYEPKERQILDEIVAVLHQHYGERLSRVVLFGSRARRDNRPDSDYDFLVVLNEQPAYIVERPALSKLVYQTCLEHDADVYCLAISRERYESEKSALLMNVREEGVEL